MPAWHVREREVLLHHPPFLTVERHHVVLPDGREIPNWQWVMTPEYVNVAAITADHRFVLFRQEKYAVEGLSLAPVGGYLEPGEDPLLAAQRELREESGYAASEWEHLGRYTVDGNRGAGVAHLYLAWGATFVGKGESDDLEAQELVLLTVDEVRQALAAGEFKVLAWATVIALALLRLQDQL
ncbi:NUDIX hydrolase [Chloroflexus islandicus]|uniref:NUDIX hydrolase n=1 Tax=Chloroflexus islandicus TaxID=1707952 RepID=A0A178LT09_9CHLR|nr:NUDIX hydrolase [Chloroflexus islandicus]OAN36354.1 NUDIX hydrolase [Chloroflexus islandicus]